MSLLEKCGIKAFTLHKIRTFCPRIEGLKMLAEGEKATLELYERHILSAENKWEEKSGFLPTYKVGKSVFSWPDQNGTGFLGRIFRQGIGIVTETLHGTSTQEDKLVETVSENGKAMIPEEEVAKVSAFLKLFQDEFWKGIPDNSQPQRSDAGDCNSSDLYRLAYDCEVKINPITEPPFEVTELEFSKEDDLRLLSDEKPIGEDLVKLVLYCLARNYGLKKTDGQKPSLADVAGEIPFGVFQEHFVAGGFPERLHNLAQTKRVFVALGRRGAVIAHTRSCNHSFLRVAALNMIEILRGRFHNMIVARTLIDQTLRDLSNLAILELKVSNEKIEKILKQMMTANHLFGLVVSDPGVFLLDGSTISLLSDQADEYFHLRSLRESTESKMNALQRFWHEYQDSERAKIISNLASQYGSGGTAQKERA